MVISVNLYLTRGHYISADYLSSSYDILEVDKDQVYQLSDLRHGLRFLKSDLYDESGRASDSFLTFIKANS